MEDVLCLHEDFWTLQVFNEQIPGKESDWDLPISLHHGQSACCMTDAWLKGNKGAAPGDIPTDPVERTGSLPGSWEDLRPEGMNISGSYSGHTVWKTNILDSQEWFRPDYLSLPAGMKLIPAMNASKSV